ncbi:MAG TPA: AtpZ/AtpI family protein [Phycisphaerae bacterium]
MTIQPGDDQPTKPSADDKKGQKGWLEDMVGRSTGLPETQRHQEIKNEKSPWSYAGVGLQFAGTTAIFALMGWYLDKKFGWTPWGMVGLTALGFVGGLYLLIKESLKEK